MGSGFEVDVEKLLESLQTKFGEGIGFCENGIGIDIITVSPEQFLPMVEHLHSVEGYDYLVDIVATHWVDIGLEYDYEVVYNLFSVDSKTRLFVKVRLATPLIPSIYHIYKSADFLEREQFDMVGVVFEGHPNLKRIYMPEYFEGHPLMKTYGEKDRSWFNLGDEMGHGLHFANIGEKHESAQKPTPDAKATTPDAKATTPDATAATATATPEAKAATPDATATTPDATAATPDAKAATPDATATTPDATATTPDATAATPEAKAATPEADGTAGGDNDKKGEVN